MEKVNIIQEIEEFTSESSEQGENLSSSEAKKLYDIYNKNKYNTLIYTKENTEKIRNQIGGKGDILKGSDWGKINKLIDESVINTNEYTTEDKTIKQDHIEAIKPKVSEQKTSTVSEKAADTNNEKVNKERLSEQEIENLENNISRINSSRDLKKYCKENNINVKQLQRTIGVSDDGSIGNITFNNLKVYIKFRERINDFTNQENQELSDEEKEKLLSVFKETEGIRKDCYSFVHHISRKMKGSSSILDNFIIYNNTFNSKKNGHKGSLTQFLRIENAQKSDYKGLIKELKNAPKNSVFLVSMNTKGKPQYEHTGFITVDENNKIYFTHGETSQKDGSTGSIKEEITDDGGYFESSTIRKRYKKGYFNLKQIV